MKIFKKNYTCFLFLDQICNWISSKCFSIKPNLDESWKPREMIYHDLRHPREVTFLNDGLKTKEKSVLLEFDIFMQARASYSIEQIFSTSV